MAVMIVATMPASAGDYYVIPDHPNASNGNQYFCGPRTSCTDENRIAQGYGTQSQPFGSLREGVYQVHVYDTDGLPDTIYVAPGIYREQAYMAGHDDIHLVADTLGVHTDSIPGEVIVTGSEPLDASSFGPDPNNPGVWVAYNVRHTDGPRICKEVPTGQTCMIVKMFEVGNPDPDLQRRSYIRLSSPATVALGAGRFFDDVYTNASGQRVTDLYVRTHTGQAPDASLGLEYTLQQVLPNWTYDMFYKYRHCFDMEVGAERNSITGFTCRHTSSICINAAAASNTITDNLIYGCNYDGVRVGGFAGTSEALVAGNEISHANFGIRVLQGEQDTYLENNVVHSNRYEGVIVDVTAAGSNGPATVYLGNNTLHGNETNLLASGLGDLVVVNNSFSDAVDANYAISTTGVGLMDSNNEVGGTVPSTTTLTSINGAAKPTDYRDPAAFDFHPQMSSLLIDLGVSTLTGGYLPTADDKDFTARTAPNDVGAYEASTCGDGIVDATLGEECDDGGRQPGDGCDQDCLIEPGYVFSGDMHATDSHCDCLYTIDNLGEKNLIDDFLPQVTTPTSMAVGPTGDVYVNDNTTRTLYLVDPATATATTVCSGMPILGGLAINHEEVPNGPKTWAPGTVFGSLRNLYVIDPATCTIDDLGVIGPNKEVIAGLDFRSDGTLFGAQLAPFGQSESLFTIDTGSAAGTVVGTIGPTFFDRVGALVFDGNDQLWVTDINSQSPRLVRLDPATADIRGEIPIEILFSGKPWNPQGLGLAYPTR